MKPNINKTLQQKYLKEILDYDPETGIFTWKVAKAASINVGGIAGSPSGDGYLRIQIDGFQHSLHRLAWIYINGVLPSEQIDHINGIRSDNRFVNLREVNHQTNQRNRRINSNNTSGTCGVVWCKSELKYRAKIMINKKTIHLGYFSILDDAISCRKAAEVVHGFHLNHGKRR